MSDPELAERIVNGDILRERYARYRRHAGCEHDSPPELSVQVVDDEDVILRRETTSRCTECGVAYILGVETWTGSAENGFHHHLDTLPPKVDQ